MSFWELVVVGVVALLVLGPEKLPGAIRSVTGTIRSIRQFGHQMKSELSDELRVHELHEKLRQAEEKLALAQAAMQAGVAPIVSNETLAKAIEDHYWKPEYRSYKRITF